MTDQLTALAVQYAPLLRALKAGAAASSGDLAEQSGIIKNHIHRSLDAVEGGGLIVRDPAGPKHVATLTATAETALEILSTQLIPANRIRRWANNPRTQFSEADDQKMARSIGDKGVLQALIVRPIAGSDDVEVIIGERRRRGSMIAIENGWQPADFLVPCKLRDLTDEEAEEIAGVENLQREDMHWMDEARWYLRLSTRPSNPLSGAQIERLVDHKRKKRSIQDYIKCARELPPHDVERTYLPEKLDDGRPNPQHLNYFNARDLVGDKATKPALDLSPKLAVTFVELVDAALGSPLTAPGELPKKLVAAFHKAPVGGPITTLATDRKLGKWIFQDGRPALEIAVTDEVAAYLAHVGYMTAPCDALYKLQAAVIGELQATALGQDARYFTSELNAPEAAPPAAPAPQTPSLDSTQPHLHDGDSTDDFGAAEHEGDEADDDSEHLEFNRAAPQPEAAAPPPSPEADQPIFLPPMLAIVLVEVAHRIMIDGVERGPGTWGVPILASYYRDARGSQLVQAHRMIAFMPMGERTLCALAKAGRDYLSETFNIGFHPDGKPTDFSLGPFQAQLLGEAQADYSTPWLNPPAEAPAAEAVSPPPPAAPPPRAEAPPRDTFSEQMVQLSRETRAMEAMAAALRHAETTLMSAGQRPLKTEVRDAAIALIQSALEAARPFLPAEAGREP